MMSKTSRHVRLVAPAVLLLLSRGAGAQDSRAPAAASRHGQAAVAPVSRAADRPTFGPFTSYQRVGVSEFTPVDSSMTYSDAAIASTTWSRFPTNSNAFGTFVATVHLPSGAILESVEFDVCDTSAAEDILATVQATSYTGENATVVGAIEAALSGCQPLTVIPPNPVQIDNYTGQLLLVVNLPTHDGTTSISGAILGYHLQVSPGPATATFNDVPVAHPFFQYVEALAAAGITGGCGGGNFCPNQPVTRGQMAVFLTKSLGMYFP
jgi:hypothetical protein